MTDEAKLLVLTDETYVHAKRYENNIERVCTRYPDGCPDHVIASCLLLEEEAVEPAYEAVVAKLQALMGINE